MVQCCRIITHTHTHTQIGKQKSKTIHNRASIYSLSSFIIIWRGKRTLFNPGWVTLHWLQQLNVIRRLYAMTLLRYKEGFKFPSKLLRVFTLEMSWYRTILIFLEYHFLTIHDFSAELVLTKPDILIFFQSYYPNIYIFHSSYKPLLTNETIKTFLEFISNNINISKKLLQWNLWIADTYGS